MNTSSQSRLGGKDFYRPASAAGMKEGAENRTVFPLPADIQKLKNKL